MTDELLQAHADSQQRLNQFTQLNRTLQDLQNGVQRLSGGSAADVTTLKREKGLLEAQEKETGAQFDVLMRAAAVLLLALLLVQFIPRPCSWFVSLGVVAGLLYLYRHQLVQVSSQTRQA